MKTFIALIIAIVFSAIGGSALGGIILPVTNATTFPDLRSPVLIEAVDYLVDHGIISGYPDGTFKPDQTINRAEALKIIFLSLGQSITDNLPPTTDNPFPDVDKSEWFAPYVQQAKLKGLIQGYPDGTYKPTQFVNKVEFVKIAMLAQSYYSPLPLSQLPTPNSELPFTDLDASQWYIPYLSFAYENNFLDKTSRFNPTDGMTRGDAAMIIFRVAKKNEEMVVEAEPGACVAETCITRPDGSMIDIAKEYPELAESPYVEFVEGKMIIGGFDESNMALTEENINKVLRSAKIDATIESTSIEDIHTIDQLYPEYYERLRGINGGKQSGDDYIDGAGYMTKTKDGMGLVFCAQTTCIFENDIIIRGYNNKGYTETFHEWIETDQGKEKIYPYIIYDLNRQQE
ncbi:MAG: S-layer homology domain-containing protein [bacterium]|nr:S-layer homology domain-containing protein [bacterium]